MRDVGERNARSQFAGREHRLGIRVGRQAAEVSDQIAHFLRARLRPSASAISRARSPRPDPSIADAACRPPPAVADRRCSRSWRCRAASGRRAGVRSPPDRPAPLHGRRVRRGPPELAGAAPGSRSACSICAGLRSRPTLERSGPSTPPRPRTMWQLAQFPFPAKNRSPAAASPGAAVPVLATAAGFFSAIT